MLERFREDARRVVIVSQDEARALGSSQIGTEHVLLALVTETGDPGGDVLVGLGVSHAAVRERVSAAGRGGEGADPTHTAFSPRAKQVLVEAARAALGLGHNYVGSEHVVLGLVRVEDCTAVEVLGSLGVAPGAARAAVLARFMNDRVAEARRA